LQLTRLQMNSLKQWRYPTGLVARDLRLDFLRGYCLVVMIIDHVGLFPAWTIGLTGGGRLWVTAAEGFILISGMVMGMMYPRLIAQRGWHWAIRHVARRAAGLFAITVIGQIIYNSGDFVLRATRGRPTGVPDNYFTLIEEAVFQSRMAPAHLALLPVFIFLMFWGLGVLYVLTQGRWRWALLGSIALWYAAQLNATMFTFVRTSFRLPSWQLLFTIGLLAGYYHVALRAWWRRLPAYHWRAALLIGSGIGLLLLSYQVSFHGLWADVDWLRIDGASVSGLSAEAGPPDHGAVGLCRFLSAAHSVLAAAAPRVGLVAAATGPAFFDGLRPAYVGSLQCGALAGLAFSRSRSRRHGFCSPGDRAGNLGRHIGDRPDPIALGASSGGVNPNAGACRVRARLFATRVTAE
jgi:hypothetical protein